MTIAGILQKTEQFLKTPSVVTYESPFMDLLVEEFESTGCQVERLDRYLIAKKGSSDQVITAHIDRHGIITNESGMPEYAIFRAKKAYEMPIIDSEALFKKAGERFVGQKVFAYAKVSGVPLAKGVVKSFSYNYPAKDLNFDIEGIEIAAAGMPIAYAPSLSRIDGMISGQIDNAINIAIVMRLLEEGLEGTVILPTEEECGRSWMHIIESLQGKPTQRIITLDTTPYDDKRAIDEGLVVLRNKDENGVFNPELVSQLRQKCEVEGIKYEMKDEAIEAQNRSLEEGKKPKPLGKTELGRVVGHTNGIFNGATLQLPTINYHTNKETTSEKSLENFFQALTKLL